MLMKKNPLQVAEDTGPEKAFYSRAPKVELYENKGQSAILLAARTRFFSTLPATSHLLPHTCQFYPQHAASKRYPK